MYTIGEIAKIVKISIDSLRYYDEIGLVKPHYIDPSSRYRYYSENQVRDLMGILEWKKYGFSLDAIRELLDCADPELLKNMLQTKAQQLRVERRELDKSIELLEGRIQRLGVGTLMEKKSVLIIDDAPFMRQILADILSKQGLQVMGSAADGEMGLAMYAELKPDLVILDIGMPGMDGIEVLRRLRTMESAARIVMCSAKGQMRTILECIKEGAGDFIAKPFQQEFMLTTLFDPNRGQYELETVDSLLSDSRVDTLTEPLAQDTINELLQLCTTKSPNHEAKIQKFWSHVM
jgi:two-component system chemotaxis response regulator CheY